MICEEYGVCEADYAIWKERSVIADCLRDLGMPALATEAMYAPANIGHIEKFLSIIKKSADKVKHSDVYERLYFAGLIYG